MKIIQAQIYEYPKDYSRRPHETFKPLKDLKVGIWLDDENVIESAVFTIEKKEKIEKHACISSQVGCKFGCKFCVSGKNGFFRNLTSDEMYNEIALLLKEESSDSFDDIMFMGTGEPLDNLENVLGSIEKINYEHLFTEKIGIATVGMPDYIGELAKLNVPVKLWISLHAADNAKRDLIIPLNKKYPVEAVLESAENYSRKTKQSVWLNYMLFKNFNDSEKDVKNLAEKLYKKEQIFSLMLTEPNKDLPDYKKASYEDILVFKEKVAEYCPDSKIRLFLSKGKEINAGCGEFAFMPKSKR